MHTRSEVNIHFFINAGGERARTKQAFPTWEQEGLGQRAALNTQDQIGSHQMTKASSPLPE